MTAATPSPTFTERCTGNSNHDAHTERAGLLGTSFIVAPPCGGYLLTGPYTGGRLIHHIHVGWLFHDAL